MLLIFFVNKEDQMNFIHCCYYKAGAGCTDQMSAVPDFFLCETAVPDTRHKEKGSIWGRATNKLFF